MKRFLFVFAFMFCLVIADKVVAQTGAWKLAGNSLAGTEKLGSKNNFDVNLVTNNITRMTIKNTGQVFTGNLTLSSSLGNGNINFTSDQQSIMFVTPGTSPSAMIYMFGTNTNNKRMVLAHSTTFSNWGLQYNDSLDQFNFLGAGNNRMAVNLNNGFVGINVASPLFTLDVSGNSRIIGNLGVQAGPNSRTIQCGNTTGSMLGIGTAEFIKDGGLNTLSFNEDVIPAADNNWALGNSTTRWTEVWAVDGTINTSDARDKTNIRDLGYGMKEIMQLHPVKFNWKNNPDAGPKLGLIAQEIKKVLPEVVRDWEYQIDEQSGKKTQIPAAKLGVMYADIIPVLIHGIQEQQTEIDELKQLVNKLSNGQAVANSSANNIVLSDTFLEQNIPNPVKTTTTISYNITNKNAQLNITDGTGIVIKQILLTEGGGSVNLDCSALSAGTYYYCIVADSKIIDKKKMVVVK